MSILNDINIGASLKKLRENKGYTVKDMLEILSDQGVSISDKTFYGWERNYRMPSADILMLLCDIYGSNDILMDFGLRKSSTFTPDALEVAKAYEGADLKQKNNVRFLLELPILKEEFDLEKNMKTS